MNKRTRNIILAVLVVALLAAGAFFCWKVFSPGAQAGDKHLEITVTHADGTTKEFEITTSGKTLGDALLQEGLVVESTESAGLYDVVDGEKADWNDGEAWWQFLAGDAALMVGIGEQEIADGESYSAVFTRGFE